MHKHKFYKPALRFTTGKVEDYTIGAVVVNVLDTSPLLLVGNVK